MTSDRSRRWFCAVLLVGALVGCAGDSEDAAPASSPELVEPDAAAPATTVGVGATTAGATSDASTTAAVPAASAPPTLPPTAPVEATGVPGLDSDDAFCAAWSRFGGTWQVVLAAAAFGGSEQAGRLEVIAAPVVTDAYDEIFAVWPDELAGEETVVADDYFGAFQRRSVEALAALQRAGADAAALATLADAWTGALGERDPANPVIEVAVPDSVAGLVDTAAADFAAQRTAIADDPSMVITASTPLTDEFLAGACPDQGTIAGGDVISE
jgi:hypothetical protein